MSGKDSVKIGDLRVDPQRRLVIRGEETIRLPKLSWDFLQCLVRHSPAIVTTDQLLDEVWGNVVVGEETVKQRASLLRQALGDSGDEARYIESARGVGYRLVPAVETSQSAVAPTTRWRGAVGALLILAAVTVVIVLFNDGEIEDRSIAVLPFEDMSPNGGQSWFSDGFHEELISRLSGNHALTVTSRTSVMPYRDADKSIGEIAGELGVGLVIEGSVRRAGEQVRVTVQLIDAPRDRHVWAQNYDRPLTVNNLFEIQADVADKVATALEVHFDAPSPTSVLPTTSLEAYDRYLLGRFHLYRASALDLKLAREHFEVAIETDPGFAEAFANLGRVWAFDGTEYGSLPPHEAYANAEKYAQAALRIDPELVEAHSLMGDILTWYYWDWDGAEAAYRRSTERTGGPDLGHVLLLSLLGRYDEARAKMDVLLERFPRDHWIRTNSAWLFLSAGNTARTIEDATVAIGIDDRVADPFAARGWAYVDEGRVDEAIEDFERHAQLLDDSAVSQSFLAYAYALAGRVEEGRALLAEIQTAAEQEFVPPEHVAIVHIALRENDAALMRLEEALELRTRGLIFLDTWSLWEPLRDDPRFEALRQAVGLPGYGAASSTGSL